MAAQPTIPPPPPPPPPQPVIPDPVRAALEFARATAKDEIESIKRLHDRTLIALFAVVAILGWFGYQNLRDSALKVAQQTVKDEVERRMSSMGVDRIIQDRLNEKTGYALTATIRTAVAAEVKKQGMSSQINQAVAAEVEALRLHVALGIIRRRVS